MNKIKLEKQKAYSDKILEYKVKSMLSYLGFDFSLCGSLFLKDIMLLTFSCPQEICSLESLYNKVTEKYENVTCGTIERDIRWAINKAYKTGVISKLNFFDETNTPKVKQVINWLFDLLYLNIYNK